MRPTLEICVDDLAGIEAAVRGGADRIELCSALELGGLTPSPALLARAVGTDVPVHAMIRPRAGDFIYDAGEITLIAHDLRRALSLGAAGVVVGALRTDGTLDAEALTRFREAAGKAALVLHRAIDLTPDPVAAVEEACQLGIDKILTSGGEKTVAAGLGTLTRMVEVAAGRLSIIAGSGVTTENAADIVRETGVREVHSSASERGAEPDARSLAFGFAAGPRRTTSAAIVERLRTALEESI